MTQAAICYARTNNGCKAMQCKGRHHDVHSRLLNNTTSDGFEVLRLDLCNMMAYTLLCTFMHPDAPHLQALGMHCLHSCSARCQAHGFAHRQTNSNRPCLRRPNWQKGQSCHPTGVFIVTWKCTTKAMSMFMTRTRHVTSEA